MFLVDNYDRLSILRILAGMVITAVLVAGGIYFFDYPVFSLVRRIDGWFWQTFIMFGAAKFLVFVSFVVLLFKLWSTGIWGRMAGDMMRFIMSGRSHLLTASAGVFTAVMTAVLIVGISKISIGRLRPVFYESMNSTGFFPLSLDDQFHSMPSGHAAASFAALVLLGLFFPRIKRYAWALAIMFGVADVITGSHFPSDAILGAFIGMLVADTVYISFKRASGN